MANTKLEFSACTHCGMLCDNVAAYHPFAACELFKRLRSGEKVEANIKAVVEYGMKAQDRGVSITEAMNNVSSVLK